MVIPIRKAISKALRRINSENMKIPAVVSQHVEEAHFREGVWIVGPLRHLLMEGHQTQLLLIRGVEGLSIFFCG